MTVMTAPSKSNFKKSRPPSLIDQFQEGNVDSNLEYTTMLLCIDSSTVKFNTLLKITYFWKLESFLEIHFNISDNTIWESKAVMLGSCPKFGLIRG